jgi:heme exporter protein A
MSQSTAAIRACNLSKWYGGRAVFEAIDLEIAPGQCVALAGANGAGKTTLLGCLAGRLRPDRGEVHWFGKPVGHDVALRRWIGMVAHESGLYSNLTLQENLAFAARMCRLDDPRRSVDRWLAWTGLAPHAAVLPTQLSRGMRQRLAIARALLHDPPLLLLDEPFTALDASGAEWLLTLFARLRDRNRTICFVTHQQEMIRRLATRVLELRDGNLRDATATLGDSPILRAA